MAARAAAGKAGDSQGAYGLLSPRGVSKIWSPPEPSREGVAGEETIPVEGEHGVREGDDQAPDNGEENGDKLVMSRASAVVATRRDSRADMAACLSSTGQRKKSP